MTLSSPHRGRQPATGLVRRRDPMRDMEDVYDRMSQLMQDFFADPGQLGQGRWPAPADIEETDDAYIVEVDLPGVQPEDVNLGLRDTELRISGEVKERERTGILRRKTRRVGQFELVVALPGEVDPDKVEARLSDGVLAINLQKAENGRNRRIEIQNS
jgi:HSP20 family protein